MKHQIRESADGKFHNLLQIDDEGNETLLASDEDPKVLEAHEAVKDKEVERVKESDIAGSKQPTDLPDPETPQTQE